MKKIKVFLFSFLMLNQSPLMGQCTSDCTGTNTFIGTNAGVNNTTGQNNTFVGNAAGLNNNSGENNSFFGSFAGFENTTGRSNSFFGNFAGFENTTGESNSFFGLSAGIRNTTGFQNSFFGKFSGEKNTTAVFNNFFGASAGQDNTTGSSNSFFGTFAGNDNTTGNSNSFFGTLSGIDNTVGVGNSFFGAESAVHVEGSGNIIMGRGAGPTSDNSNINMRLYIDVDTLDSDGNNNPLIYGEFDNDFVRINGTFEVTGGLTNPSSRALKQEFVALDPLTVLTQLSTLDIQEWTYKHSPNEKHVGPVAEDFYKLFGLGEGDKNISTIDADGIMMLAIQALKEENEILKMKLETQEEQQVRQDELIHEILRKLE